MPEKDAVWFAAEREAEKDLTAAAKLAVIDNDKKLREIEARMGQHDTRNLMQNRS